MGITFKKALLHLIYFQQKVQENSATKPSFWHQAYKCIPELVANVLS